MTEVRWYVTDVTLKDEIQTVPSFPFLLSSLSGDVTYKFDAFVNLICSQLITRAVTLTRESYSIDLLT